MEFVTVKLCLNLPQRNDKSRPTGQNGIHKMKKTWFTLLPASYSLCVAFPGHSLLIQQAISQYGVLVFLEPHSGSCSLVMIVWPTQGYQRERGHLQAVCEYQQEHRKVGPLGVSMVPWWLSFFCFQRSVLSNLSQKLPHACLVSWIKHFEIWARLRSCITCII